MSLYRSLPFALGVFHLATWLVNGAKPAAECAQPVAHIHVPPGFAIERVADADLVRFPMFAVFDDRGRLFVAESSGLDLYAELVAQTRKCRIRLLEDRDADGRFDSSHVFADQLVFPMGLVWREGKLFVADPPDLVVLRDTDGDDRCDKRTAILTGFGHRDNGSLHGLVFGPDGWLYMTMGSPDGYRLQLADGSVVEGESGALIRCRPDGTDPQVLCRGFENLVEVVFTPRGDVLGTANWFRDVNQPGSEGLRDALVHLVDGGLYPYHREIGTPQPVTGKPLGAVSLFPAVALSGLTQYRGRAFPAQMRGNLFSAQHNSRKIGRHELVPRGSTYRSMDSDFATSDDPDFHPSDVVEDGDGSLLIVDTGSWYIHHCPTAQMRSTRAPGGIYRVRFEAANVPRDPWGLAEDWDAAPIARLCSLLRDTRPAVRDRAFRALVSAGEAAVPSLSAALRVGNTELTSEPSLGQLNITWILSVIGTESALDCLRSVLEDPSDDVVVAVARALAQHKDQRAAPTLCKLLSGEPASVRFAAAESLAHCGTAESLPAIWDALASGPDRFLEHALIHAAGRLADSDRLRAALGHPHPRVRKAALVLLSQPPRSRDALTPSMVVTCIGQSDAELRASALSILLGRQEWAAAACALVNEWLSQTNLPIGQMDELQEIVLAFQANAEMQELVAGALAPGANVPPQLRAALLEALARSDLAQQPQPWIDAVGRAIEDANAAVRADAVRTAAIWQLEPHDRALAKVADSQNESIDVRLIALQATISRRPNLTPSAFHMLVSQLAQDVSPLRRLAAAEILGKASLTDAQLRLLLPAVSGDSLIGPDVLLPAVTQSAGKDSSVTVLDFLADSIGRGWRPTETHLREIIKTLPAVDEEKTEELVTALRRHRAHEASTLRDLEALLSGGDAQRGRAVFFDQKAACAACHRIGSDGGDVGPDLTKIGSVRAGQDLLESIAFPSASFAQGYQSYRVTTTDGRSVVGVIEEKSERFVFLREQSGARRRLMLSDVESMDRLPTSLMPEGLSNVMSRDQLRDLLAFLETLK
jgi:putative membrane-bound dehydrogenase-like protein